MRHACVHTHQQLPAQKRGQGTKRGLGGARGRGPNAFSPRQRQHFKDFSPILLRLEKCQKGDRNEEREREVRECEEYKKESGGGGVKLISLKQPLKWAERCFVCAGSKLISSTHTHTHTLTHTPSNTHLAQILKFRNSLLKIMEK